MMSKNSRQIDYRLRLAKSVERKMLVTAFQRLSIFQPLNKYRYVGFGAYYFSDFYLFHKSLGIEKMLSIEKSRGSEAEARYNFNKPFSCIDIDFNESNIALPNVDWKLPSIVWLDYTSELNSSIIVDIDTVMKNAMSGSIILVSFAASADDFLIESESSNYVAGFQKKIGKINMPREITNKDFAGSSLHVLFAKTLLKKIEEANITRNFGTKTNNYSFEQLFNFQYTDGKPMYSFGGIIIDKKVHSDEFKKAQFSDLSFVNKSLKPFLIKIPNLTIKEIKFLENYMPSLINEDGSFNSEIQVLDDPCIPINDVKKFASLYKFFPTFTESSFG